jgi:hypothetical protein
MAILDVYKFPELYTRNGLRLLRASGQAAVGRRQIKAWHANGSLVAILA